MDVELATSFKGGIRRDTADYVRFSRDDFGWFVVIVEGGDGFLSWWQDGSRVVADWFASVWKNRTDQLEGQLIARAAKGVPAAFSDLPNYDGDGWASVIAAYQDHGTDTVWVEWVGGGQALQLRDDKIVQRTRPHTLWNEWVDQGHAPRDDDERARAKAAFPHHEVIGRTLSSTTQSPEDRVRWEVKDGDLIVLASSELDDKACDLVIAQSSLEKRATRVAEHARSLRKTSAFGAAVAVIELRAPSPHLPKAIVVR